MSTEERTFIIGDVHGCLIMLKRLVDKIDWRPGKDRLIFLGDYIDRGEDSRGVIDYIIALSKVSPHVQCLLGNHESSFLSFLEGGDVRPFLLNGGETTLRCYDVYDTAEMHNIVPHDHLVFLRSLRPWIELDDYYVVHAGFRPGVALDNQRLDDMVWIREEFLLSGYDFGKTVIFGHTPFAEPFVTKGKIGLDTGAVYGNKLTCLELPSFKFHWVEASSLD
ncbi:MAG: serine/threonine protein phosphatase [Deltaproteobacteria bacterium]|nr:serine/threonine protein phosphatase [Deltaproteobacteria bacterium]MBW2136536.1 serine/threonine protein phosphatase [Deltaproteobacteria bacterium]